ncbi:Uncharacterised protein [Blautia wexlerae]|uniref:Uncharacterized protein n=1 Tax=Blautia wexlerae TaxID=418240 RepID=A0A174CD09_9FIRM|nr:Uncharacterised protein [Blautia wexlerae]
MITRGISRDIVSRDCLVDIIITMNKNCKGGTDMAQQKEGGSIYSQKYRKVIGYKKHVGGCRIAEYLL